MSNEVLTLLNTCAISHEKIRNQPFPRISKMLPVATFYSLSQIEIARKFIGSLFAPHSREQFEPKWSKKEPAQIFSFENNLSIYALK